jgi:hypothetical protein
MGRSTSCGAKRVTRVLGPASSDAGSMASPVVTTASTSSRPTASQSLFSVAPWSMNPELRLTSTRGLPGAWRQDDGSAPLTASRSGPTDR